MLSLISKNVGVAVAVPGAKNALEHVYFSRLGDQKVLAVVVTRAGLVRDRVLRLDISQADLDAAARYINENFRGWTMSEMRAELQRRLEAERSEYDRLMQSLPPADALMIERRYVHGMSIKQIAKQTWATVSAP